MCESPPDITGRVVAIRTGDHNYFFILKTNTSTMPVDKADVSLEEAYMNDNKVKVNVSAKRQMLVVVGCRKCR